MARSRNIKPGLFKNEELAECSIWARWLFPGLWTIADREGKLEDRPKRIKGELLAFDEKAVDPLLNELQEHGFILRYAVNGEKYIKILKFTKHQNPHHKEIPSVIPEPESPGLLPHSISQKPEANISFNEPNASVLPQSCPGLLPQEAQFHEPISRLIPDSLNLIPDSLTQVAAPLDNTRVPENFAAAAMQQIAATSQKFKGNGETEPETAPDGATPSAAGQWAGDLRRRGLVVTSQHPTLRAWIADGFTLPQAIEALQIAQERKPGEKIHAGYLDPILRNPPKESTPSWWTSEATITAKGAEVGVTARAGENWDQFKARIQDAIKRNRAASA